MSATNGKKVRRVFWLAYNVSSAHKEHAMQLNKRGYAVKFFPSLKALTTELALNRVGIIVVGDGGSEREVSESIESIASMPELQGARLILSVSHHDQTMADLAAAWGFRDILPLNLGEKHWVSRFLYATARTKTTVDVPETAIGMNSVATVALPGRLVWLSESRLVFESRMRPQVGSVVVMKGAFPETIGLKKISLTVEETRRTDLMFRFSDAIVARWDVPESAKERAEAILGNLRQTDFGPRVKVFVAVQSSHLRASLVAELDPLRFEVNIALQKHSVVDEPKYFCPQIVFVEDKMCVGDNQERFREMLSNLGPGVPVYVIGNRVQLKVLSSMDPARPIHQLQSIPNRLTDEIFTKFLPPSSRRAVNSDPDSIHIAPDHPFSIVEVSSPARLSRVHPRHAKLATAVKVNDFGLCKIDAPVLRRNLGYAPYIKITESHESPNSVAGSFLHVAEGYLCNVGSEAQSKLAKSLTTYATQQILSEFKLVAQPVELPMAANDAPQVRTPIVRVPRERSRLENVSMEVESMDSSFDRFYEVITSKKFLKNLASLGAVAFLIAMFYGVVVVVAPNFERSGGTYTESLRQFAPKRFKNNDSTSNPNERERPRPLPARRLDDIPEESGWPLKKGDD